MRRVWLAAALLAVIAAAGAQAPSAGVENSGFEGSYRAVSQPGATARINGQIAPGWDDNSSWADVDIAYARDASNPHRGQAAQRITVSRVTSGAAQFVQSVQFQKGRVYEFRVWLRGTGGASVGLLLRQAGAPYATFAEARATLSPEWREFRVAGIVPETTGGLLLLRAAEPMTISLDDARLLDRTNEVSNAAPRRGNLVSGGSFEAGMSFGWSTRFEGPMGNRFADPRPRIDRTTAAVGKQSLRADILPGDDAQIRSPAFAYNFNRPHSAAVWLRAGAENTPVVLRLGNVGIEQTVSAGTQWRRYTLRGTPPYRSFTRLDITVPPVAENGPRRTVWVDGAQVEEKTEPSPGYVAAAPVELTLDLPRPGRIVFDDETNAVVRVGVGPPAPPGARLRLSVENLRGQRRALPDVRLPAATFPLPAFPGRPGGVFTRGVFTRGVFKLRGEIVDAAGQPLSSPVEMVWARLPRPRNIAPQRSFFGAHIPLSPDHIRIARATGHRWARLHDTSMIAKWPVAEPEPGQWRFYDAGVTAARSGGLAILGMLDGAPRRVSTKPREGGYWGIWHIPDAPGALSAWENYVRTVARHYRGRIDHWEVWNEPWGQWWLDAGGTPELYGRLLRAAYAAAKAANPGATIVGIDTFRGHETRWTEPALRAAGLGSFDVFSFHDYNDAIYGGSDNFAALHAGRFRDAQRRFGDPKPLWNTEGGVFGVGSFYLPDLGGMSPAQQVAYAIRYDVSYMSAGVAKCFVYALHTDPAMGDNETRLTEHDRAIRPLLAARAVLASLADGAGRPTRSEPVRGVDAYAFPKQNKRAVTVLWAYDGAAHPIAVPAGARVLDAFANPLPRQKRVTVGAEPIYFVTGGSAAR